MIDPLQEAFRLAVLARERFKAQFESLGLRIDPPKLEWFKPGSVAEVSLWIWDGKGLYDVVEYFALYEGNPVATGEEITEWLDTTFNETLERRHREEE